MLQKWFDKIIESFENLIEQLNKGHNNANGRKKEGCIQQKGKKCCKEVRKKNASSTVWFLAASSLAGKKEPHRWKAILRRCAGHQPKKE